MVSWQEVFTWVYSDHNVDIKGDFMSLSYRIAHRFFPPHVVTWLPWCSPTPPRALRRQMLINPLITNMGIHRSRFIRHGLPLLALVVIGSFGLAEFTSIRVQKRDEKNRMLSAEETLRFQKKVQRVDVDEEYQKICRELDLDNWENKRLPRPPDT